jgi:1-acyl-sn-glycerol-3-phosphate acyltransferase
MLKHFLNRQPGRPWWRIAWWHMLHLLCYVWFFACYRFRGWGVHNVPRTGPILLVSNHQSFLDPIIIGLAAHHRQFSAMARSTLFLNPIFSWLIRSLNALPVAQGEGDLRAMRRCIDILKQGQALLVFPEGARCKDGHTADFQPGTMLLIKRAKPQVVPVALEGAFEVWPHFRSVPKAFGHIKVIYGEPIPAERLIAMTSQDATRYLRDTVEAMRLELSKTVSRD